MSQKLGEKLKSRDNFHMHYLVLWNLMMSIESNVVTSEEAEFLYPFDMSKKDSSTANTKAVTRSYDFFER